MSKPKESAPPCITEWLLAHFWPNVGLAQALLEGLLQAHISSKGMDHWEAPTLALRCGMSSIAPERVVLLDPQHTPGHSHCRSPSLAKGTLVHCRVVDSIYAQLHRAAIQHCTGMPALVAAEVCLWNQMWFHQVPMLPGLRGTGYMPSALHCGHGQVAPSPHGQWPIKDLMLTLGSAGWCLNAGPSSRWGFCNQV